MADLNRRPARCERAALPTELTAYGVNDGDRTRDSRHHKPALCLLSYIHHEGRQRAEPEGDVSLLICRPARAEGLEPPTL
jgi:hypothetical protein